MGWDRALAGMIDHTLLRADATAQEVSGLCAEARRYGFAAVCIQPVWVRHAAAMLAGSGVAVCTVIGFPLGANTTAVKAYEAGQAVADGATELDMVLQIGALKDGDLQRVQADIAAVVAAAGTAVVKVILETALLTDREKATACRLAQAAGAGYVKTSTGFSRAGATVDDVALLRRTVGRDLGVKAAGGIRDRAAATALIRAGASRIGASASVAIVTAAADPDEPTDSL